MAYKDPSHLAETLVNNNHGFVLDKEKYPDVETTPYGFIYNVNGHSITDSTSQRRKLMPSHFKEGVDYGFTLTEGGDEVYYPDFDSAYKAAKGI